MSFAKVAVGAPLFPNDLFFDYAIPKGLLDLVKVGSLVEINFRHKKSWGVVFELSEKSTVPPSKLKSLTDLKFERAVFDPLRMNFLKWLSEYYFYPLGMVCECALPGPIRKGTERTLKFEKKEISFQIKQENFKTLNQSQKKSVQEIIESPLPSHLLWGVTGSGKTEVYMHLIKDCLENNKEALILVPEIALTPQFLERFEEKFPGQIAIFHSSQKATQLRKNWLEVFHGQKKIVLGARSALFAPLFNLGLIIVDEEHEGSYKQDERLRYHARDCAQKLAELYSAKIVLGSATPSLESYQATKEKKMGLSVLKSRAVENAVLPKITLVDLKKNIALKNLDPTANIPTTQEQQWRGPETKKFYYFSQELITKLNEIEASQKQGILFLNRRGLGRQVVCTSCGLTPECPSCKVSLTPHKKGLLCHYCAYLEKDWGQCLSCQKGALEDVGLGTEALEEELNLHFPKLKSLRLDRDTSEKQGELERILESFKNKEADILIGTQMVAKGHDFPHVTLVGIMLADTGFSLPDFRSTERSLQLLTQVAGRAGRDKNKGHVLVQSFHAEQEVYQYLDNSQFQDGIESYQKFLDKESEERHLLGYPPFSQIIALKLDSNIESLVEKASTHISHALNKAAPNNFEVLGPVPAPLSKIKNRYRWQIILKSYNNLASRQALEWILKVWHEKKLEQKFRTRLVIDVDPVAML